jgi:acetylornithine deacetylase/succinyl-diaminopimelate desuccinylase-like protein
MIPNPAVDLVSVLNMIYNNIQFQIKSLKTPYRLTDDEEYLINNLLKEVNIDEIMKKAGIEQILEEDPQKAFFNYLFKPTFNISSLKSGFLKEGSKNYVPNLAICNIDIRFAHDISVEKIFNEIKEKIEDFSKQTKSKIDIIKNVGYENSRIDKNSPLVRSLIKSAEILGFSSVIWPLSAANAPLSKIKKELGLEFITGGLGIGGLAHSTNEFIQLESIINARLLYYYFLREYSKRSAEKRF